MCIDYRLLNKNTRVDRFPLPKIDNLLDKLAKVQFFTKIDLANAYHQIEIADKDQHKIAFNVKKGYLSTR